MANRQIQEMLCEKHWRIKIQKPTGSNVFPFIQQSTQQPRMAKMSIPTKQTVGFAKTKIDNAIKIIVEADVPDTSNCSDHRSEAGTMDSDSFSPTDIEPFSPDNKINITVNDFQYTTILWNTSIW